MQLIVFLIVFMSVTYETKAIITKTMDVNCDSTISLYSSVLLKLTSQRKYQTNMDCTVTLKPSDLHLNRLMLTFKHIDIFGTPPSCYWDRLMIYDGTSNMSLTGRNGLCGTITAATMYQTTQDTVTLNFRTNIHGLQGYGGDGFTVLLTSFSNGVCRSTEFACSNLRCVAQLVACDGNNNCGDNSDEVSGCSNNPSGTSTIPGPSTGTLVGSIFAGIGGTIFFIVLVVFAISRRRTYHERITRHMVAPFPTVSQTVTHHTIVPQPEMYCYDQHQVEPPCNDNYHVAPPCYDEYPQFSYPVESCETY